MAFTGRENHSITLEEARKLTANYRNRAGKDAVLAGFFGKETIQKIIDQDGCVGIRYYYALTDEGKPALVLVGVDANENDIIDGVIAEVSLPCPPYCGEEATLRS